MDRTGGMEFQSKKVLKPVKVVVPDQVSQEIRNLTAENPSTEMYTQQEHAVCTMYTIQVCSKYTK